MTKRWKRLWKTQIALLLAIMLACSPVTQMVSRAMGTYSVKLKATTDVNLTIQIEVDGEVAENGLSGSRVLYDWNFGKVTGEQISIYNKENNLWKTGVNTLDVAAQQCQAFLKMSQNK